MFAPAPNTYQIPETINAKGTYTNSKFINSKACRISQSAQSRFKSFDTSKSFNTKSSSYKFPCAR